MENEYKGKTNEQVLKEIANKNTCSEFEEKFIQYWALQLGFKKVVVTCGVVYPFGVGQAYSLNQFAEQLVNAFNKARS